MTTRLLSALGLAVLAAIPALADKGEFAPDAKFPAIKDSSAKTASVPGVAVSVHIALRPVPAPPDPAVRGAFSSLYSVYVAVRGELLKMHRAAGQYAGTAAIDRELVELLGTLDGDVRSLGRADAARLNQPGFGDDLRLDLYTGLRAANGALTREQAEARVGISAAPRDPLASVHRGDGKDPSPELLEFRRYLERRVER